MELRRKVQGSRKKAQGKRAKGFFAFYLEPFTCLY